MKLKVFTISLLLSFAPGLGTKPVLAQVRSSAYCKDAVNYFLNFDLEKAASSLNPVQLRISKKNPISIALAQDAYFLKHGFRRVQSKELNLQHRQSCERLALQIHNQLLRYFHRRLIFLLDKNLIDEFVIEARNVLAPYQSEKQMQAVKDLVFFDLDELYLEKLKLELFSKLRDTRWERYQKIKFKLVVWSPEWNKRSTPETPAAVHFESRRIALRPLTYSTQELLFFLFHEISHLDQEGLMTEADQRLANEIYAWKQTIDFIDDPAAPKVPQLFSTIRRGIQTLGLEHWVASRKRAGAGY